MSHPRLARLTFGSTLLLLSLSLLTATAVNAQPLSAGIPGRNVNIVGETPPGYIPENYRQQNEVSCAIDPENRLYIFCAGNDYRGVDLPIVGDSWQGAYMSRNGGKTWLSRLQPWYWGHPESIGQEFAADPTVIAIPGMVFTNFIASFREDRGDGGIYFSRWVKVSKENGFPWEPVDITLMFRNSGGRFIDKPAGFFSIAGDGSTTSLAVPDGQGGTVQREFPAGVLTFGYVVFTSNRQNSNANSDSNKLLITQSYDLGSTWTQPTKLSESKELNQGVTINGFGNTLVAVWRRFNDNNETNALFYARSIDLGQTWSKPTKIQDICPFDQPTTANSFRTNAFPVLTHDGSLFRLVWTDRANFAGGSDCSGGLARIVMRTSADGQSWSAPVALDNVAAGIQYMPWLSSAHGETVAAWYDTRDDNFPAYDFVTSQGVLRGVIFDQFDPVSGVLQRHSADVRAVRIRGSQVSPSVKVSQYLVGDNPFTPGVRDIIQLENNFVNRRGFRSASVPFNGDYKATAFRQFREKFNADGSVAKNSNGNTIWEPNAGPPAFPQYVGEEPTVIAWADNRDVRGNSWGTLADAEPIGFTPPTLADGVGDVPATGTCDPSEPQDRTREQNIYASYLQPGLLISNLSAPKALRGFQRAYAVQVRNNSAEPRSFLLRIENQPPDAVPGSPTGGRASFRQFPIAGQTLPLYDTLVVEIPPNTAAARTLFVNSSVPRPQILVTATGTNLPPGEEPAVASITLNADIAAPDIVNPDIVNPDIVNPDIVNAEVHNPDIENKTVSRNISNPDIENPDIENPDIVNLGYENPDIENPDIVNFTIDNPDIENRTLAFPDIENPDIENGGLTDGADGTTDIIWPLTNNGNTTTSYTLKVGAAGPLDGLEAQLIVFVPYAQDTTRNCVPVEIAQNAILANIPDVRIEGDFEVPDIENLGLGDATFGLQPGQTAYALLRIPDPTISENKFGLRIQSQAQNSDGTSSDTNPFDQTDFEFDATPPTISIDIEQTTYEATDPAGAIVTFSATASDSGDAVPVDCAPTSGEFFPLGTTTTACNAEDEVGNTATETFDVTVEDTTAPVLVLPGGGVVSANADTLGGAIVTFEVSATDAATDPAVLAAAIDCSRESGSLFAPGTTTVDCSVTDAGGNTASDSFDVIVTDIASPVVSLPTTTAPADLSAVPAVDAAGAVVTFSGESATDVVDGALTPICTPASGSIFPLGTTTVTCSATDASGNTGSASFDVTVVDVTPPVVTVPADILGVPATDPAGAVVNYSGQSALDNVDGSLSPVCSPSSGSVFPLGATTVTCTATDAAGNTGSASFSVTIADAGPPVVFVPADITAEADRTDGRIVDYTVSALDAVDGALPVACAPLGPGAVFPVGATLVTCSATDSSGNTGAASFTVTITDTTGPVLGPLPGPLTAEATGPAGAVVTWTDPTATDLIDGSVAVSCAPVSGSTFPLGATTVTCTATDSGGNVSTASFDVTVQDTTPPALSLPGDFTVDIEGPAGALVEYTATASDTVSGDVPVACTPASGTTFPPGATTVACSATDASGSEATGSFEVRVQYGGFLGLFSPYEPPPKQFNLGKSIPLSWQYADSFGNVVDSMDAMPRIRITGPFACNAIPTDEEGPVVLEVNDPGSSDLRYSTGTWKYNWETVGPGIERGCYNIRIFEDFTGRVDGPFPIRLR